MPVLDEEAGVADRLAALQSWRAQGVEVIVADGGSSDRTPQIAAGLCDRLLLARRGRAAQMNAGAAVARGDVLLFLHADTRLPENALAEIRGALDAPDRVWGRFDVTIEGRSPLLPLVGAMMNLRSRLTGIATGDQAVFVRRGAFEQAGRFPDIPLMEDIALSRALKKIARPACLRAKVRTSGRRWDNNGALRTILLMWRLRLAYFLGVHPARLAVRYGYRPAPGNDAEAA
ncbi:MAG: TIGR04283 family arsenosugar biosynthesis glycosyltransferase [Beijerinckiaceae bacterium]